MYAAIGVLLGTFVGVLPGIGPAMALALLLPVTYGLDVTQALIMFAGIYYGGMYGGSTTSILLNTPGESASVMTAIEGNKMAKKGRAAQALATAAIGSFIAGTIGTLLVAFFTPSIAGWAVEIGAPSYFAIMLLSMVLVSSVLGASKLRGFIAPRHRAHHRPGRPRPLHRPGAAHRRLLELADGVDIVVVAVGVFAIGEALWTAAHLRRKPIDVIPVGRPFMGRDDWRRSWGPWLRGTALGFPFGALPAGGAETPTFLSYITERKLAGRRAAPTSSARARSRAWPAPRPPTTPARPACSSRCSPSACRSPRRRRSCSRRCRSTASCPGPTLMTDQPDLIWTLLASLLIGNTLLLVINLPLAPLWAKLLQIPRPQLYAGILFFACLGAYSVDQSSFDLALLLVFGGLGFAIRRFGIPVLPLILGVILGPLMEVKMREALDLSDGAVSGLFNEPLAIFVYILVVLAIVVPLLIARFRPPALLEQHHDQEVA